MGIGGRPPDALRSVPFEVEVVVALFRREEAGWKPFGGAIEPLAVEEGDVIASMMPSR